MDDLEKINSLNKNIFPFKTIEEKERNKIIENHKEGKKIYILEMFSYPSGNIHMGHVRNYSIVDIFARYYHLKGYNVFCPLGFDAFGLPAENAAIENKIHPQKWTEKNIEKMKEDLKDLHFWYNSENFLKTCHKDYYKHQQKLFIEFYKAGLVEKKESWVNWDPVDKTVLANEQVLEDGTGWRSKAKVERKKISQWFFKVSKYSEKLLNNLKTLKEWPSYIKEAQDKWIGKSEGYIINFLDKNNKEIKVFTTKPETVFECTFLAISKESDIGNLFEENRTIFTCEDTNGKKIGTVINPFTEKEIPVYIGDYVLNDYGTGVVMGVPTYDKRDKKFANEFNIPTQIEEQEQKCDYNNPEEVNKLIKSMNLEKIVQYKLKDWCISRQRYWGAPIPVIYCEKCSIVLDENLPVELPYDIDFSKGGNPLENHDKFLNINCPLCEGKARRETDTMDTFVDSSWYFLRFPFTNNEKEPFDKEHINEWLPVDIYVGGAEHANLHLIYSRFFTMALKDMKELNFEEPFKKLINQGMVCAHSYSDENNKYYPLEEIEENENKYFFKDKEVYKSKYPTKMSKSLKNTISPNSIVKIYGANTLRFFIISDSPVNKDFIWNTNSLKGCLKFINKVWRTTHLLKEYLEQKTIKESFNQEVADLFRKIEQAIVTVHFNLYVTHLRVLHDKIKEAISNGYDYKFLREMYKRYLICLWPVCPQLASSSFEILFNQDISKEKWI